MTNPIIDNSADSELNKVILWQYDSAEHLIGIIEMFKSFFSESTGGLWDLMTSITNISKAENTDDFGLSLWGRLVGVARPLVNGESMSTELYRRIIVGRMRLSISNASVKSYIDFANYVFGGKVSVVDNSDMSISFYWNGDAESELEQEMKWVLENIPDSVFAYPTGIKSSTPSRGPIFGFDGQQPIEDSDMLIDTLNNCVLNWK